MKTLFLCTRQSSVKYLQKESKRNQEPIHVSVRSEVSNVEADCMGGFPPGFDLSEPQDIDFVLPVGQAYTFRCC